MSVQAWTYIFVGLTFGLYLTIAWLSRVRDTKGFYVAGQGVPSLANGMATAADFILVPEIPVDVDRMCRVLKERRAGGKL